MFKVGLVGYGKAGKAVARVLAEDERTQLCWILRRQAAPDETMEGCAEVPVHGMQGLDLDTWLDAHPVDAVIDFSDADSVLWYGPTLARRGVMLVTAVSSYPQQQLDLLHDMGRNTRVMCSPNITLGINFLLLAARLLRSIAPFADVEIVEQHFREKPEISGTARKIASQLSLEEDKVTSLRVGGIVGHHEVIFGFPHQTVRLIHDSIRREAFGTGAVFALMELARCGNGMHTLEDVLTRHIRDELLHAPEVQA